ncbi:L-ascorbate metabolism protein UlaG, beta-lactamase superfamily [Mucilaginibacter gossypiicola]|uniref:L-ascorbate metabolism protein UlaG, beta-lactamase superfamily n=1 Tax=Mucilaginibacter gossypiicola TaxID=551995 RepID=A0A1H8G4X1_9SPHI|nr:MBL fold metallo-hydrolase [Mucilaginibacter gossypiicola]SEN39042.1 L-ascorbate metabolism protein UlaG, beta-lactamase superfamily [Mucilaginibacter gossypiicola]
MNEEQLYLKPNVVMEPLVDKWYAWSHLISPATAAMNIVGRHLAIIESYLMAPAIHANAVLNPKMKGGPFMDFGGGRIDEVTELQEQSLEKQKNVIEFAKAIKTLDRLLDAEATGYGLEDLYTKVPEILKGYVELYYDRNNNPGFRFFESLLYQSEFYNKSSQSLAMWITNNDERPFCLSTPRLNEPDVLSLDVPFDHACIDALAKMKRTPNSFAAIKGLCGIAPEQEPLFKTFFTETPPPPYEKYAGDKIRMRYFGHACILVETKDISILVDPLISYYGYSSDVQHFSDVDLPDTIDYVLITHNHQDHILFETLLPLRHKIKNLIVPRTSSGKLEDPDLKLMFNSIGFNNVMDISEMQTIHFNDAIITGLPFIGEHSDMNILTKACYLVKIGDFKLLFLADSRIVEPRLYELVHKHIGNVDVLFIGMECDGAPLTWLYGPLLTKKLARDMDGSRRLAGSDCDKGMALIDIFEPKEAYVYAMGQEPWVEFISSIKYTDESNPIVQSDKLVKLCTERGIIAERLYGEKELLYNKQVDSLVEQ